MTNNLKQVIIYLSSEIEIFSERSKIMAYIDRNLTKGETVVLRARPGWFGLVFAWIVPIVLAIVTFVVRGSIGDNNEMIGNILWIPLGVVTLFFIFKEQFISLRR